MKTVSIVSITALSLLLLAGCRDAGEERDEVEANDPDADSATLRREAMKEWFDEANDSADPSTPWSSDYRKFLLHAAGRERQAWASLLPASQARVSGSTWINIGPTKANWERNGSTLNVTDSGRTRTILIDGTRVYLATAGGGVWRTDDGGGTWTPLTETLGSLSCGSLAMDPANHRTLYLGLGDPFDGTGIGLVKSTNGGDSWSAPVLLGAATIIPQVIVDPSDSNVVLAATNKGLYRSTDAGASFSLVSIATGQSGVPYVWTIDSTGPGAFVLSLEAAPSAGTTTSDGQIWTSGDHGATWARATGVTATTGVGRITVAAAPSNRQVVYALAAVPNKSGLDLADLFKSTDGGRTWTALGARSKSYTNASATGTVATSGIYLRGVGVAASSVDVIGAVGTGGRVYVSTNGGSTWATVASGKAGSAGALPNNNLSLSDLLFDPANPSTIYVASVAATPTASHLWKSTNSGATWAPIDGTGAANGFPTGIGVNTIKADPDTSAGTVLYVGTQLGVYRSTDGGATWSRFGAGMPLVSVTDLYISPDSSLMRAATFGRGFWELTGAAASSTNDFSLSANPTGVSIVRGASAPITVSTAVTSGSAESVSLSAGSLPAGATATFAPASVSAGGSTTLTLATLPSTAPGTYSVAVTGTAPSGTHSTTVTLTVAAPATGADFRISASPTSLQVSRGGSAQATVSTALVSGSAESVALSVSGLPSGATATFTPASVTAGGISTLRLTAGSATPAGTYAVTVAGTSPSVSHTTPVTFTVVSAATAADFGISASPASLSIAAAGTAQTTIQTTVVSGSDQVALAVAGLPAGVTAAFSPASVAAGTPATLTFTAAATVKAGSYALLVTGKGSAATHTISVGLTVAATPAPRSSTAASTLGCSSSGQGGAAGGGALLVALGLALRASRRRFGRAAPAPARPLV